LQHSTVNISIAGVGVDPRQLQRSGADLAQPTASIRIKAIIAAILEDTRKNSAHVVAADGQIVPPEENITATFNRADRHARSVVATGVQIAVTENLHASRAASRITTKENCASTPATNPPIAGQRAIARRCILRQ